MNKLSRRIDVNAIDLDGHLVSRAKFHWYLNDEYVGTAQDTGQASLDILDEDALVKIVAEFKGIKKDVILAQAQTSYTFNFDVKLFPYWRDFFMKHFPTVIGILFILIAVILAFAFPEPSQLQRHLVLAMFSLGGGGFGGEIAGFIKVDMTLTDKLTIAAGGAAAIFVLLFFFVPAGAA